MKYSKNVMLKDGTQCVIRHGDSADAQELLDVFIRTHGETDYLTSYPDEGTRSSEQETALLEEMESNARETELCAVVNGSVVGSAGIVAAGEREKLRHRCSFGIAILREAWGNGIGRALTEACIECAKAAGYEQMELEVVAENRSAIGLYHALGFVEFGRNPKGFKARSGYQELIYMRRDLTES